MAHMTRGTERPSTPLLSRKTTKHFQRTTAMADPVSLRRIGLAFSGIVAIVVMVAAMTVSAGMGVP
jgi:hypothetical protein